MSKKTPTISYDEFDRSGMEPQESAALRRLVELAEQVMAHRELVATMEADLKSAKERLRSLEEGELPDLMLENQLQEFKLKNGTKIGIKDLVFGSLPKEEDARQRAIRWVEDHDGGSLIKTDLSLSFGKTEHNMALDLAGRLRDEGFEPQIEHGIHPMSLQAWARELVREGKEVNFELLGLQTARKAVITSPRAPR